MHKMNWLKLLYYKYTALSYIQQRDMYTCNVDYISDINKIRIIGHVAQTMLIRITCLAWFNLQEIVFMANDWML